MLSPIANHLWQSTLFASVVALLTFALRKNQARTRYWLWLIASAKFLLPFSVLIALGQQIEWSSAPKAQQLTAVMGQIGQPFTQEPFFALTVHNPALAQSSILPAILMAIWICGLVAVGISWWRRWRRVHAAIRAGSPLLMDIGLPVLSSPMLMEPGVFGLFHPVLLLPQGILNHLSAAQLDAVIAHEKCHVRRRDNLTAAIHMAVEAIFWFHPLVWWLGARLVEERERACDEEVLRLGNEPQIYAESILKTCQFYLESPLTCVSGITGADLKQRVIRIMTHGLEQKLDLWRKSLLAAAGTVALAGPILVGLLHAPQTQAQSQREIDKPTHSFEVVSIKLNSAGLPGSRINAQPGGRFITENVPLRHLLKDAYGLKDSQLLGAPSWLDSERYDIQAKMDDASVRAMKMMDDSQRWEQLSQLLRSLFLDRCKLVAHHETKDLPVYVLLLGKNAPKFQETALTAAELAPPDPNSPRGPLPKGPKATMDRGHLTMVGVPMDLLAETLSMQAGRPVLNQTGLKAKYDFELQWTPDDSPASSFKADAGGPGAEVPPSEASAAPLFTAVQEQLGLKLEAHKTPMDVLVIDHIERPSVN